MKTFASIGFVATLGLSALVADTYMNSRSSHLHGTSIFHWTVRKALVPENPGDNAPSGSVLATHKRQGNAEKQALLIVTRGLQPNTTYQLFALIEGTPGSVTIADEPGYTAITEFTTSSRGTAALRSKKIASSKGFQNVSERFRLPTGLDPIQMVQELVITDLADPPQPLLRADLTEPDRWQYLIKRELTNPDDDDGYEDDAEGVLRLKGHHNTGWFRLYVAGLEPNTDYSLVKNDDEDTAETVRTDAEGCLYTLTYLPDPADLPDLRTLAIWDNTDDQNVILTTDLLDP